MSDDDLVARLKNGHEWRDHMKLRREAAAASRHWKWNCCVAERGRARAALTGGHHAQD